ncbi:MAG: isochorismate synthase, partial [Sinomonas sp.]|nr:isochorismate synthase [Sinomonas sp.]
MTSPLRALTIDLGPVDLGALEPGAADPGHGFPFGSLADALHHPGALCWIRRGEGQLGFGEVARYEVTGPDRFIEAEAWWKQFTLDAEAEDPLQHPGTGPIAFGSFAFSKTSSHASRLIVPEFVVGIRDGRAWATHLTTDGRRPSERELRAAVGRWTSPEAPAALNGSRLSVRAGRLGEQHWMSAVASGVRHIRAGELEKLVLARDVVVEDDGGIPRARVLRRLASAYRDCWVYGVDGLVGATPEMLIQVEGRTAQARVLAGTLDRREAAGEGPGYAERVLAGSAKQRHEHQIAIESLTTALEPFSEALNAHDEPFILELPNVYHLASDVKAELAESEG